ncbi:conserved Plasmodium protein, unknown function [Plasmodium vinckei]|uniref:Uncharacterized protein n=1 Tax=Plasmodium vinckei TaxID=5860 RepID=A0A6V7TG25_PLAVN|nr:conserved Plasmodium protein, unknown function [Plasmodium vinckei]
MDKYENTNDISNFLIGQELIIDKLLFEKKYLTNKRKSKIKGTNKLSYYLNDKFNTFLGYDSFINTIYKKEKKFKCNISERKKGKREKQIKNETINSNDSSSEYKSKNSNPNSLKLKNKRCANISSINAPIKKRREGSAETNNVEKNEITIEPKEQPLHDDNENKYLNTCKEMKNDNKSLNNINSDIIKKETEACNFLYTTQLLNNNINNFSDAIESNNCTSSSWHSDTSEISNVSPDMVCFEKQFKYIYDMYKKNDKNVYLFYNPPVCKCTNKILKERYFQNLYIQYPCLFNCSFNDDTQIEKGDNIKKEEDIKHEQTANIDGKNNCTTSKEIKEEGINMKKDEMNNHITNEDQNNKINNMNKISIGEVSSYAVELKLYAKAFFELYFFEKCYDKIKNDCAHTWGRKVNSDNYSGAQSESMANEPITSLTKEDEDMLKTYFYKCLYKIITNKSNTCNNNSCCGLLYVPYSYIIVILNRKVENLTYVCTNLKLPSNTDIYYNNKKNVITICTKNLEHEFFIYYCLKQDKYIKNIIIYDIYYDGFIPFFKPLLNLKSKKNQENIINYINYNKNVNLSIVFFLTQSRENESKNKTLNENGNKKCETIRNIYSDKEEEVNNEKNIVSDNVNDALNGLRPNGPSEKEVEEAKNMNLQICRIVNINHRIGFKLGTNTHASGNSSTNRMNVNKKNSHLTSQRDENNIENYFSNICNGSEVINNMNINMVVDKILKIVNKKDSMCNDKCIYHNYNKNNMKNKEVQIYLCEAINSFAFDRRPLCIKKRDITLSTYANFYKIINNYNSNKNQNKLHDIIKNHLDHDVFKKGVMKKNILLNCGYSSKGKDNNTYQIEEAQANEFPDGIKTGIECLSNGDKDTSTKNNINEQNESHLYTENNSNIALKSERKNIYSTSDDEKIKTKETDNIFNEMFFIFNDNSDLYTYEECKQSRIDSINKVNENNIKKNRTYNRNALWDMLSTRYLQALFNIYVCSYLIEQNNYNINRMEKKKKKKLKSIPYEYKENIIKNYYYYLFKLYKSKFNVILEESEEDMIHKSVWK